MKLLQLPAFRNGADDQAEAFGPDGASNMAQPFALFHARHAAEMPTSLWPGISTWKRPGKETCDVTRGPLVPIGSLITWTMISWPFFSGARSVLRVPSAFKTSISTMGVGTLPSVRPTSATSEKCRKASLSPQG